MADATYGNSRAADRTDDTTYMTPVLRRTSWGAVIAGTVVAIGLQMILTVIGIAIGATTRDFMNQPTTEVRDTVPMMAAIWWLVSGTISILVGACIVGRFAGMVRGSDVLLHGLTMWGMTALFGFMVVTSGAGMLYGSSMGAAYEGAQRLTAQDYRGAAMRTGGTAGLANNETRSTVDGTTVSVRDDSAAGGAASVNATDRPLTEADAEAARRYVRNASWWTLFGLMLGVAASLAGAWFTAPERIVLHTQVRTNA